MATNRLATLTTSNLFQPHFDKIAANTLLTYILHGDADNARKLYRLHPHLLFLTGKAYEHAAGLDENEQPVNRIIKATPAQALAGTGDAHLLSEVISALRNMQYHDRVTGKSGIQLLREHISQQLPTDYEAPKNHYNFAPLYQAIEKDESLKTTGQPNPETLALLNKFRQDFLPQATATGHYFNLNILKAVHEYFKEPFSDSYKPKWSKHQKGFVWCCVIGYLFRLLPAYDMQNVCYGLLRNYHFYKEISRSFEIESGIMKDDKINIFPLDLKPERRLGIDFGMVSCQYQSSIALRNGGMCTNWQPKPDIIAGYIKQKSRHWREALIELANCDKVYNIQLKS